jgi:nicotinamidase-related amidase
LKSAGDLLIPTTLEDLLQPSKVALIVYDMQVGICGQVREAPQIVQQTIRLLGAARAAGVRTIFTRRMSLPRELMGVMQYRTAMAWQRIAEPAEVRPWFLRDSPGFAITPELEPRPSEAIFDKIAMSAFEGTPLATALRDCGITAAIFAGIAMEIGIEPSCRHAADLGFVPILAADACGHGHAEAAQRSIDALAFAGDTVISDVDTICRTLNSATPATTTP